MKLIAHRSTEYILEKIAENKHYNRTFLIIGGVESGKTFVGKYLAANILSIKVWNSTDPNFEYFEGSSKYAETLESFVNASTKKPFNGLNTVLFLDNLDLIPQNACNKILKTIEEPSPQTTIILSASSEDSVLDTIVSRSFIINLRAKSLEEKIAILESYDILDHKSRLLQSPSIKTCISPEFASKIQELNRYKGIFIDALRVDSDAGLYKCILELDSDKSFDISEFILAISSSYKDSDIVELSKYARYAKDYVNRFALIYSIISQIRQWTLKS